jgi:uncharacterized membrane protein YGL010W
MRKIDSLLIQYGESHQHSTNKMIHWICVPLIMLSLFGVLMSIPFPGGTKMWINWPVLLLGMALVYYLSLSLSMFIGFVLIGGSMVIINYLIFSYLEEIHLHMLLFSISLFILGWIGQFWGHRIEGKKPSFLQDVQFLLVGPAWLLHFIYNKLRIPF